MAPVRANGLSRQCSSFPSYPPGGKLFKEFNTLRRILHVPLAVKRDLLRARIPGKQLADGVQG